MGFQVGFWDYATFGALFIIGAAIGGAFLLILGLPGKITIARKHPEAEAVNLMGWVGFLGVVPWIQALIWAIKPTDVVDIRRFPREEQAAIEEDIVRITGKPVSATSQAPEEEKKPCLGRQLRRRTGKCHREQIGFQKKIIYRRYTQMKKKGPKSVKMFARYVAATALSLIVLLGTSAGVSADEADAKRILKAMSDYMGAQKSLSFAFDATLEVVTTDDQKLALASSGTVTLERPDKIRVTRKGGFADVEMFFDGKTLTLLGKNLNVYTQLDVPGTIDHLIDELRDTYQRPLPAADLLVSNPYDALMPDVVDVKDLGSGVIGGVECDFLAFRTNEVDFQIWIAQGRRPYPCRYVITSKRISGGPQYTIQTRDWKTGSEVAATDFSFKNTTKAKKVELKDLKVDALPDNFKRGETK